MKYKKLLEDINLLKMKEEHKLKITINNINKGLTKHLFLTSLTLNFTLFALTYLFFTPRFITNDDVGMLLKVSGIFSSEYNEFILFSNVLIAYGLNYLYSLSISIPWYSLYLIFSIFISHVIFLYLILKRNSKISALLFYTLYYIFVGLFITLNLQFTIVATLTSLAGLSLLFLHSGNSVFHIILGIVVFVFGSLIRWNSALLAVIVFSFTYLIFYFPFKQKIKFHVKNILILTVAILFAFSFQKFNEYKFNNTKGYESFYKFNKLRAKLVDNKHFEYVNKNEQKESLNKASWSYNDYLMLTKFFFYDKEKYSTQNFEHLIKNKKTQLQKLSIESIKYWFEKRMSSYTLLFIITAFILLFLQNPNLKNSFKITIYFIGVFSLLFLIILYFKPPPYRVFAPLLSFGSLLPLLFFNKQQNLFSKFSNLRIKKIVLSMLLIIIVFFSYKTLLHHKKASRFNKQTFEAFNKKVNYLNKDNIYIIWGHHFKTKHLNPLKDISFLKELNLISIGVFQQTPYNSKLAKQYKIKDLYLDIVSRENIYIFANSENAECFKVYIKENYNLETEFKEKYNPYYHLYDFSILKNK